MRTPDPDTRRMDKCRAFVRPAGTLDTVTTQLGLPAPDLNSAQVFDLSSTGVGLVLSCAFQPGAMLLLRLPSTRGWTSRVVRVLRCTEVTPGVFQVSCSFLKPFSSAQVQALRRP